MSIKRSELNGAEPFFHVPEITHKIFSLSIPPLQSLSPSVVNRFSRTPWPSVRQAPLSISHVCRYWRDLSLSCSNLWDSASLSDCEDFRILAFKAWSIRSGQHPMVVRFLEYDNEKLHDLFLGVSNRCTRVTLQGGREPTPWLIGPAFEILSGGCPLLKRLTINIQSHLPDQPAILCVSALPRLEMIELEGSGIIKVVTNGVQSNLQWLNLHMVFRWADVMDQFRSFISLKRAFITLSSRSMDSRTFLPVTSSNLTSLVIWFCPDSEDVSFDFLDSLEAPCLEQLAMCDPPHHAQFRDEGALARRAEHIRSFVRRSRPPLESLILPTISMSTPSFLSMLRETPQLRTLFVEGELFTDDLLEALSVTDEELGGAHACLPVLKRISMKDFSPDSPELFTAFIVSRCQRRTSPSLDDNISLSQPMHPHASLEEIDILYLPFCPMPDFIRDLHLRAEIRECINNGFILNVR